MVSEHDIAELLRTNERDRSMQPDEMARVRQRLGLEAPRTGSGPGGTTRGVDIELIDVSAPVAPSAIDRRTRPIAWAAAAVFLLVAGFALFVQGTDGSGSVDTVASEPDDSVIVATPDVVVPTTAPTATAAGAAFCEGPFAELVAGMRAWRGVDEWSRLNDEREAEPHLPTLLIVALDGLAPLASQDNVAAQRDAMVAALDDRTSLIGADRRERVDAMVGAVAFIDEAIAADLAGGSTHFLDCDRAQLIEAASPTG